MRGGDGVARGGEGWELDRRRHCRQASRRRHQRTAHRRSSVATRPAEEEATPTRRDTVTPEDGSKNKGPTTSVDHPAVAFWLRK
jgi:hypothetical protein